MRDIDLTLPSDDGLPIAAHSPSPTAPARTRLSCCCTDLGALTATPMPAAKENLGGPLASALAAEGIATLRYDRRGVGALPVTGVRLASPITAMMPPRRSARLAVRPDIRAEAMSVIGHSEGAIHAMSLAARSGVTAAVLLAAVARPGEEALRWQGR